MRGDGEWTGQRVTGQLRDQLGQWGIWRGAYQLTGELAASLEGYGFGALWVGGSPDGDLVKVEELLDATRTLTIGTSIVNIWKDDPHEVARSFARVRQRHPGRFVLGAGAGHPEATQQYQRPYQTLASYADTLLDDGVPRDALVLAALGPRVLRLARDRTAGAIPYLVPPEHTRLAREVLGPEPLLAPEQKAVLTPTSAAPGRWAASGCASRISAWSTTPVICAGSARRTPI